MLFSINESPNMHGTFFTAERTKEANNNRESINVIMLDTIIKIELLNNRVGHLRTIKSIIENSLF